MDKVSVERSVWSRPLEIVVAKQSSRFPQGVLPIISWSSLAIAAVLVLALIVVTSGRPARAAPATACSEIPVGATLSLTGKYSTGGNLMRQGYEFAVDQIRKAGGIKMAGRCHVIRVIYYDDELTPSRAVELTRQLIARDGVNFLLGPYAAEIAAAVAPVAEQAKIPLLLAGATAPSDVAVAAASLGLPSRKPYVFKLLTPSEDHLTAALDLAARVLRYSGRDSAELKMAATFAMDPYNREIASVFRRKAEDRDIPILMDEQPGSDPQALRSFLGSVKRMAPDMLLIAAQAGGVVSAMQLLQEMQVHVPMVVMTSCRAADLTGRFGVAAENMLCAGRPRQSLDPAAGVFANADAFENAFHLYQSELGVQSVKASPGDAVAGTSDLPRHRVPDEVIQSALAVRVLANAFEQAGLRDRDEVRNALAETDLPTVFGRLRFDAAARAIALPLVLHQIQDGKYNIVAPAAKATHSLNWPRGGL